MILIVVESLAKSKKINKFLENEDEKYIVCGSFGHIENLPKNRLGVDKINWIPEYEITNKKIANDIKNKSKDCKYVLLAGDSDLEGDQICKSISDLIDKNIPRYRIIFHEITKNAILKAINDKHDLNLDRVKAQNTRRMLDRIVGYGLSPTLWNHFNINTLSAGRVQSCLLSIIINKSQEVYNPIEKINYSIKADFKDELINTNYINKKLYDLSNDKILNKIDILSEYKIEYKIKDSIQNPAPPYTTSQIQIDIANLFNINSKKTMDILQKLYESSYITYHRTNSTCVSFLFKNLCNKYIIENYGDIYSKPRSYGISDKNPHEAIRVVDIKRVNIDKDDLSNKIYNLIWKRSIKSQMSSAIYDQYDILIHNDIDYFETIKKKLKFIGFLIIDNKEIDKTIFNIPKITKILKIKTNLTIDKLTLYNDSTIIKIMQDINIGTPATYASTITNLFDKGYIEYTTNPSKQINLIEYYKNANNPDIISKKNVILDLYTKGNNKMIHNTDIGNNVIQYLNTISPYILNKETTQKIEEKLELISNGQYNNKELLNEFNFELNKSIEKSNQIKPINNINRIIDTKYGKSILTTDKKYINIEGYLKQFNKKDITEKEIDFLINLPIQCNEQNIINGKFGLYLQLTNELSHKKISQYDFNIFIEFISDKKLNYDILFKNSNKVIDTKYGKCILTIDKKFINIDGYLNQFNKKEITKKEIDFLIKLPFLYNNNYIYNGKYGLYFKSKDNLTNIKIDKNELKNIISIYCN